MATENSLENAREALLKLDQKRLALEQRVHSLSMQLVAPGMPGLKGNLVDSEGFPRNDVDLYAVRKLRNELACAKTDLKKVTDQVSDALIQYHSGKKALQAANKFQSGSVQSTSAATSTTTTTNNNTNTQQDRPFAFINKVEEGGPAHAAGLRVGDYLVAFDSVKAHNHRNLQAVAETVRSHIGQPLTVQVLRRKARKETGPSDRQWTWNREESSELTFTLIPKEWSGRGLLGMNIVPNLIMAFQ